MTHPDKLSANKSVKPKKCPFCGINPAYSSKNEYAYHPSLGDKGDCILEQYEFKMPGWNMRYDG